MARSEQDASNPKYRAIWAPGSNSGLRILIRHAYYRFQPLLTHACMSEEAEIFLVNQGYRLLDWTNNIQADARHEASIDFRLRDEETVRDQVRKSLEAICSILESLQDYYGIFDLTDAEMEDDQPLSPSSTTDPETRSPVEDPLAFFSNDGQPQDLDSLHETIKDEIDALNRLPVLQLRSLHVYTIMEDERDDTSWEYEEYGVSDRDSIIAVMGDETNDAFEEYEEYDESDSDSIIRRVSELNLWYGYESGHPKVYCQSDGDLAGGRGPEPSGDTSPTISSDGDASWVKRDASWKYRLLACGWKLSSWCEKRLGRALQNFKSYKWTVP